MPWMAAVNLREPPVQLGLAERKAQSNPYRLRMRSRIPPIELGGRCQVTIGKDRPLMNSRAASWATYLPRSAPRASHALRT